MARRSEAESDTPRSGNGAASGIAEEEAVAAASVAAAVGRSLEAEFQRESGRRRAILPMLLAYFLPIRIVLIGFGVGCLREAPRLPTNQHINPQP